MSKKNKSTLKSNCCNAIVKIEEGTDFGKGKDYEGTYYYSCTECKQPCDVHADERKVWTINPKTRVVPNKKKDRKFTDAECRKFRDEGDF
jgi:hypothetical protein